MELTYILVISGLLLGSILVLTGLFSFIWRYLLDARKNKRIAVLEDSVFSLEQTLRSQKGVAVRTANKEQAEMRQTEAFMAVKTAMDGGADWKETLKGVGMQFPDVAIKLGMEGLKKASKAGLLK